MASQEERIKWRASVMERGGAEWLLMRSVDVTQERKLGPELEEEFQAWLCLDDTQPIAIIPSDLELLEELVKIFEQEKANDRA